MAVVPVRLSALLVAATLWLTGCAELSYYGQSISGHFQVMARSEPIEDVLARDSVEPDVRDALQMVLELRHFAAEELALDAGDSYLEYADLERDYVVWNVFAAPEFSLQLKRWCYPFAGCVVYRGYFAEADANTLAAQLATQGYDTYVAGVPAYSTLGWFDDPVLSTFVDWPRVHLAGLIFHELAHQRLYVPDDSEFNESFASAVSQAGVRRWLALQEDAAVLEAFDLYLQRRARVNALMTQTREALLQLYRPGRQPSSSLRAQKRSLIETMNRDYQSMRREWDGDARFDHWIDGGINNARLAALATYESRVPEFLSLLDLCDHDFECLYSKAAKLASKPEG